MNLELREVMVIYRWKSSVYLELTMYTPIFNTMSTS